MLIDVINSYIESLDIDKLKVVLEIASVNASKNSSNIIGNALKEYNPKTHNIHNKTLRQDKQIKNNEGEVTKTIKVARLSLAEQKKIVLLASSFLGTPKLESNPKDEKENEVLNIFEQIHNTNKMDYKFKEICNRTLSETECAEVWYLQQVEKNYWDNTILQGKEFKLRCQIISPALGYTLYPVFDEYGDMILFACYYKRNEYIDGKSVEVYFMDVYTNEFIYLLRKEQSSWVYVESKEKGINGKIINTIGKIPVIYYSQEQTEWHDVQEAIERLETKISNHADTNDYFDSPIVVSKGEVKGFADKGEQGKLLTAENGADVSYLTWDNAPESMKMEVENLQSFIGCLTHTPNISFDNIKTLGNFSGIALKMFFMDAHMKASQKEELFGQCIIRRINYIKSVLNILLPNVKEVNTLTIKPKFTYFLPKDVDGEVNTLCKAYQAGILSKETAVKLNPLVTDYMSELELINSSTKTNNVLGGGTN